MTGLKIDPHASWGGLRLQAEQTSSERQKKLLNKLLDQVISDKIYKTHNSNLENELYEKKQELENLNDYQKDLSEYIVFGLYLIQNIDVLFKKANVSVKSKLMSSIFDEKIEFDGEKYRTPQFKEGFGYIYMKINELESVLNKTGDNFSKVSHLVELAGFEPASRYENHISSTCLDNY